MASSAAQSEIASELEKKKEMEEDDNPEEPMDDDDDEEDAGEGDDGDVEEDVVVQIGETYSCKRQDGSFHDAEIVKTRMNKQAGREEFFVHFVGLNRRQNEWVEKTRLVVPKLVTEGQVANNMDPEAAEDGKASLKRKNEDGASEAKRAKVTVETATSSDSEMGSGDFGEELTCLLCSKLFKDPVMVECGHNFCRNCIEKAWNNQESFTCPDCKEVITDKMYTTNRALANLVKKTVGNSAVPGKPTKKPKPTENCPEHDERLKLYCKDDGTLSCIICRDSLKHANHNFLPIMDAVEVCRTELSTFVAPLEEAFKVTEQLTTQQSKKVEQHKSTVTESREYIVSEFEKVRTFLKEREQKLLERLKEDGETLLEEMETNMVNLQERQKNIKEAIATAKEKMNDTDSTCFLMDIKSLIEKCQEEQKEVMVARNTLLSKDLCMGTFKGPIQYSVLKQMKLIIKPPSKTVWIVGHSFVYWAKDHAERSPYGTQLDFPEDWCKIFWFGKKDLMWRGMRKLIETAANQAPAPDILVIHAGGNDLSRFKYHLIDDLKADIESWMTRWPEAKVVWSFIIKRNCWLGNRAVESARKWVNTNTIKFLLPKGGLALNHNISSKDPKMFKPGGDQLSEAGLKLFNSSLHSKLKKCLDEMADL